MDVDVSQMGEGTVTESNIIHVPTSEFAPDILINNTTYPIALQAYTDSEVIIKLDKFQTKVVTLTDDQVMGASYDRIDNATRKTVKKLTSEKFTKAIHAIAPTTNTANTPVIATTGSADATGRLRLVYADLVNLKNQFDKIKTPLVGRRLVLCADHYNDLLLDRANFGDQLVNYVRGQVAPVIAGFEIFQYEVMPVFTSGTKKSYGAIAIAGDKTASVAFLADNIAKKTGNTKQYFTAAKDNPTTQTNQLAYRHYFIAVPFRAEMIGAII
jgi:Flp pilus assembly protein TadG